MADVECRTTCRRRALSGLLASGVVIGAAALVKDAATEVFAVTSPRPTVSALRGAGVASAGGSSAISDDNSLHLAGALAATAACAAATAGQRSRRVRRAACKREGHHFPSIKAQCIHPDRDDDKICGDCPRNGKCAAAAFVSSAKATCIHPDRDDDKICGDCPRNGKFAAAAFVSSAKATCIHPDRDDDKICGDCPRNSKMPAAVQSDVEVRLETGCAVAAASFISSD